jgi:hypothetical protein
MDVHQLHGVKLWGLIGRLVGPLGSVGPILTSNVLVSLVGPQCWYVLLR